MKLCRFNAGRTGLVWPDGVVDVTDRLGAGQGSPLKTLAALSPAELQAGPRLPLDRLSLLPPVVRPGKIVAAPVNYHAHIAEMTAAGMMAGHSADIAEAGLFLKAPSSLTGPAEGIRLAFPDRRTDFELELVAVIGRAARNVDEASALAHVAGWCLGLDITLRGPEDRSFRKSLDTFSVVGPWLTTADEIADPQDLRLTLHQNGEPRQDASTADMVWSVARLIAFASRFYTLHPGDMLFTGTPAGVGPIRPGDRLDAACPALGSMTVRVSAAEDEG